MIALSVVSQKGGVGKTTVALNTAFAMARRGYRTLLVDLDPQGGIGLSLQKLQPGPGVAGYVARTLPLDRVMVRTKLEQLTLLPVGNVAIEDTHAFASRLNDGAVLKRLLADAAGEFELVMFDTPSGFGGATMGALRVSSAAMSPLQAEPLAMRSAAQLLEVLGALRKQGAAVQLAGFVLTMLAVRQAESLNVATEAWSEFPSESVLQTNVPRDPVFLKASAAGVPVGLLARNAPPAASLFDQLALELEARLGLRKEVKDDGPLSLLP